MWIRNDWRLGRCTSIDLLSCVYSWWCERPFWIECACWTWNSRDRPEFPTWNSLGIEGMEILPSRRSQIVSHDLFFFLFFPQMQRNWPPGGPAPYTHTTLVIGYFTLIFLPWCGVLTSCHGKWGMIWVQHCVCACVCVHNTLQFLPYIMCERTISEMCCVSMEMAGLWSLVPPSHLLSSPLIPPSCKPPNAH